MKRYLYEQIRQDLQKKLVVLTGPRQIGKTTLSQQLMEALPDSQYLNFDVLPHRLVINAQQWRQSAPLLIFDEIHKMQDWKTWLKGVFDGRAAQQQILVTGSARMETFRQGGDSLAGRYFRLRLHPLSVREWVEAQRVSPQLALNHLLKRGGFPEPALADNDTEADRWRSSYFNDLIREDVLEFSRVQEINTMRLFAEMLRSRVGSPLSLASIARDLSVSPTTLARYLEILESLFIVFSVRPWHHNIARATLKSPKVYFYDTGLVLGDEGIRFENLVACHLLKKVQWQQDVAGETVNLHYIRTKDDAEVDFVLSQADSITDLIECKLHATSSHKPLHRFSAQWPLAKAIQLVKECSNEADIQTVQVRDAANWLNALDV
jgi:predicted AAA+ superfamily ATPase